MWQLSPDQAQALAALQRERHLARLAEALGAAFPAVQARVAERFGELVDVGVQHGQVHGLHHLLALARYLACWFVLGAEFEAKPGFEWAQGILGSGRSEGAKVYQLCRRAGEALSSLAARTAAGAPKSAIVQPADFAQALAQLDLALLAAGRFGALSRPQRLVLGSACDLDALALRTAAAPPSAYRLEQGSWRFGPGSVESPPMLATFDGPSRQLPPQAYVVAAGAGEPARMRLRVAAGTCCELHPLVTLASPLGLREWRGRDAASLDLPLAPALASAGSAADFADPGGRIGVESPPGACAVQVASCGLRDEGEPLGSQSVQVQVYRGEQQMLAWQREAWPELQWPGAQAPTLAHRARFERDGQALDASRWVQSLQALDQQLFAALGRLAAAWERESGVSDGRLVAEPRLMSGRAALTWGWSPSPQGAVHPPVWRVAGQLELLASRLDLRLSGTLTLHGSRNRLHLHVAAADELQARWDRDRLDADLAEQLAAAQFRWRHPFVLAIDAYAQDEAAMLDAIGPVQGALVGACGLRPREDGPGLQWFCQLALEAVSVPLLSHDPLLGQQRVQQSLLPAMPLVDWSA